MVWALYPLSAAFNQLHELTGPHPGLVIAVTPAVVSTLTLSSNPTMVSVHSTPALRLRIVLISDMTPVPLEASDQRSQSPTC